MSGDAAMFDSDDLIDRLRRAAAELTNAALERDGDAWEDLLGKRDGVDAALQLVITAPDWASACFELNDAALRANAREAPGWELAQEIAVDYYQNRPITTF